jgi:hypothetical protein
MVASLRYLDTFVKTEGAWLFAERSARLEFVPMTRRARRLYRWNAQSYFQFSVPIQLQLEHFRNWRRPLPQGLGSEGPSEPHASASGGNCENAFGVGVWAVQLRLHGLLRKMKVGMRVPLTNSWLLDLRGLPQFLNAQVCSFLWPA